MSSASFLNDLDITSDVITKSVHSALNEDIGSGDLTAQLVPVSAASAQIVCREFAVLCGIPWANAVFNAVDSDLVVDWRVVDGDTIEQNQVVCQLSGNVRSILSAERCALNFLQCLSGTATSTFHFVEQLSGSPTQLLDTRKTLPGLRLAQKYAVRCGGGLSHRRGLYDAVLFKENHIAGRDIGSLVGEARQRFPGVFVEVEVESLAQLGVALAAGPDRVMLDNFSLDDIRTGVGLVQGQVPLEVSGVDVRDLVEVARCGVDFVSLGCLTKDVKAVDFSLLVV